MLESGIKSKPRLQVSMDQDLVEWIDKKVKDKVFASRSHAIEYSIKQLITRELKGKKILPIESENN